MGVARSAISDLLSLPGAVVFEVIETIQEDLGCEPSDDRRKTAGGRPSRKLLKMPHHIKAS